MILRTNSSHVPVCCCSCDVSCPHPLIQCQLTLLTTRCEYCSHGYIWVPFSDYNLTANYSNLRWPGQDLLLVSLHQGAGQLGQSLAFFTKHTGFIYMHMHITTKCTLQAGCRSPSRPGSSCVSSLCQVVHHQVDQALFMCQVRASSIQWGVTGVLEII